MLITNFVDPIICIVVLARKLNTIPCSRSHRKVGARHTRVWCKEKVSIRRKAAVPFLAILVAVTEFPFLERLVILASFDFVMTRYVMHSLFSLIGVFTVHDSRRSTTRGQ